MECFAGIDQLPLPAQDVYPFLCGSHIVGKGEIRARLELLTDLRPNGPVNLEFEFVWICHHPLTRLIKVVPYHTSSMRSNWGERGVRVLVRE